MRIVHELIKCIKIFSHLILSVNRQYESIVIYLKCDINSFKILSTTAFK